MGGGRVGQEVQAARSGPHVDLVDQVGFLYSGLVKFLDRSGVGIELLGPEAEVLDVPEDDDLDRVPANLLGFTRLGGGFVLRRRGGQPEEGK